MTEPAPQKKPEARLIFRVLAGGLAVLALLIGLPMFVVFHNWWNALLQLFIGVGFGTLAITGRWFGFTKR